MVLQSRNHCRRMLSVLVVATLLVLQVCYSNGFSYSTTTTQQALPKFKSNDLQMGVRSSVKSFFNDRFSIKTRTDDELKSGIAKFYDESSSIWLDVWGEDMHHGYYPTKDFKDHKAAQVAMIDNSLEWSYGPNYKEELTKMKSMVDVGCGVGGSSRHIIKKYDGTGVGISLSPYQIMRANKFTDEANLSSKLKYQVADAMNMPFPENSFDLCWSMESGEHMPDKEKFVKELKRVTAPGGRIIIVTWCHRELNPGETSLTDKEQRLLQKINDAYYLPEWCAPSKYIEIAKSLGLEDIRQDDWSKYVEPFWPAVIRSSLKLGNLLRLLRTGKTTLKGAIASTWMQRGLKKELVKFTVITAKKPTLKAQENN